ncbi:tetratricopeptide repeat protein [Treponema phagedenis]|nr:tetratricopeptide repeat protein [Treponema phagedenis]
MYLISLIAVLSLSIVFLLVFLLKTFLAPHKITRIEKNINAGRYTNAIKQAKSALAKNPQNFAARYLLGKAYLADDKPELALAEFKIIGKTKVFTNIKEEIEFRSTIARLYLKFDQPEEALKEYALLVKLDPHCADFHYCIGQLFEQKNMSDMAINYYKRAIDLNPKHAPAYAALGLLYFRSGLLSDAKEAIDTVLKFGPDNTDALYYQGRLLRETKDYAHALTALEKAARDPALRKKCFIEKGRCYLEAQSTEKALFEFERALKLTKQDDSPATLQLRYFLAACYEKQREFDKAIEQWQLIRAVSPHFKDIAEKLSQYQGLQSNDHMKEYLTLSSVDFIRLCTVIAEQAFKLHVKSQKEMKQGCIIVGTPAEAEKWSNVRAQPKIIVFFRDSEIITDSFLRSLLEQMKTKAFTRGIVVSPSGFSRSAISFAETRPIDLIDEDSFKQLLENAEIAFKH